MKGIPQGRYTKEFRQEAVKLVTEEGLSWGEAAPQLSLPTSTLSNWVKAAKAAAKSLPGALRVRLSRALFTNLLSVVCSVVVDNSL